MTLAPQPPRRLLRMLGHTQGTRSATVCHWRCADQCAQVHPVRSTAPTFEEVAQSAISRRSVLQGGIGALMFSANAATEEERLERLAVEMAAHGMSLVEVSRRGVRRPWEPVRDSRYNRRIHQQTAFQMTGAAAGSDYLRTSEDRSGTVVHGTVNNCAGGTTPWGTVLSGEENFQGYFKRNVDLDPRNEVYGIGGGRGWEAVEPRWDLSNEPNEVNRFGWIVELDPNDPTSTPRKHTALGRFKHEGATVSIAGDGRAVAVMGDDQGGEYIYKFISRKTFRPGSSPQDRAHNLTLLEDGDLYVARFEAAGDPASTYDGTGLWLPLVKDGASRVPGFSVEEILVFTRAAADTVSPTPMDRPEDVQRNPHNGYVYEALTNNSGRTGVDPANPRTRNRYGQVAEIQESDAADLTFTWSLVVVCGDPEDPTTYFSGYPKDEVSPISSPDNVAFDDAGNLWISTDGQDNLGLADALHLVPVEGPERGHVQQFLSVPVGAETCGPVIDEESSSVFVAVQHPGDVSDASPQNPASTFPYGRTAYPADNVKGSRPAVIQVYRTS